MAKKVIVGHSGSLSDATAEAVRVKIAAALNLKPADVLILPVAGLTASVVDVCEDKKPAPQPAAAPTGGDVGGPPADTGSGYGTRSRR